jgi:hypothetical protein
LASSGSEGSEVLRNGRVDYPDHAGGAVVDRIDAIAHEVDGGGGIRDREVPDRDGMISLGRKSFAFEACKSTREASVKG